MLDPQVRLRLRRRALGLSQTDLARRVGTSQSAIAAIESGQRSLSAGMETKLPEALETRPSELLQRNLQAILDAAEARGLGHVQVFGSVARGEDTTSSDIDFMADIADHHRRLFPPVAFAMDAEQILGVDVSILWEVIAVAGQRLKSGARRR